MDENKSLKMSRYVFGGGVLLYFLFFASRSLLGESGSILFFISYGLMVYGLYANLKAKGLNPFRKKRFYTAVLLLLWPDMGPLIAIGIMFGTPDPNAPAQKWRTALLSSWMIALYGCVAVGLIAYPQLYAIRVARAQADFKEVKRHLAVAREGGKNDEVRKELDEAASRLAAVRRSALTDSNTNWFVRYSLGNRIINESELTALEKEVASAKANLPSQIKRTP